jgi:hypothetical protein
MDLIDGKHAAPSPAEHDGFENSRFEQGEEVEVSFRAPNGAGEIARLTGFCVARYTGVDASRDEQDSFNKDLIHLKGLTGPGGTPYEGAASHTGEGEAFFAEEAVRKMGGDPLDDVSFN